MSGPTAHPTDTLSGEAHSCSISTARKQKGSVIYVSRVSINDVRKTYSRVVAAAQAIGFDTSGWRFEEGNSTNGVNYRLTIPGRGLDVGYGRNFLGRTATEAHTALIYLARAWELAAEVIRPIG